MSFTDNFRDEQAHTAERLRREAATKQIADWRAYEAGRTDGTEPQALLTPTEVDFATDFIDLMRQHGMPGAKLLFVKTQRTVQPRLTDRILGFRSYVKQETSTTSGYLIGVLGIEMPAQPILPSNAPPASVVKSGQEYCSVLARPEYSQQPIVPWRGGIHNENPVFLCADGRLRTKRFKWETGELATNLDLSRRPSFTPGGIVRVDFTDTRALRHDQDYLYCMPLERLLPVIAATQLS